ncbi:prohibitin family protein [Candidatus Methylobacter oryzae]|nr:prohibitin family protein [Candidatus Methylobacter oryzae]
MSNSPEPFIKRNLATIITLVLITVLFLAFFWSSVVISIKSGEVGVLYRRFGQGTVTDMTYPEGITLIFPWNIMYIYDTRIQQHPHNMVALTKEGLKVELEISIRYYPELETVGILHQRVGPDYLNKIVIPEVESNIRVQVGQLTIDQMYSPDPALLQLMVNDTMDQLEKNYITIQGVVITRITLPQSIETVMENKIESKELADTYEYRIEVEKLEAKRKLIEAEGIKAFNETINKSLTTDILKWQGIQATVALSNSDNSKIVVIGNGSKEMPIILGGESDSSKHQAK